jgi:hypothetical protein
VFVAPGAGAGAPARPRARVADVGPAGAAASRPVRALRAAIIADDSRAISTAFTEAPDTCAMDFATALITMAADGLPPAAADACNDAVDAAFLAMEESITGVGVEPTALQRLQGLGALMALAASGAFFDLQQPTLDAMRSASEGVGERIAVTLGQQCYTLPLLVAMRWPAAAGLPRVLPALTARLDATRPEARYGCACLRLMLGGSNGEVVSPTQQLKDAVVVAERGWDLGFDPRLAAAAFSVLVSHLAHADTMTLPQVQDLVAAAQRVQTRRVMDADLEAKLYGPWKAAVQRAWADGPARAAPSLAFAGELVKVLDVSNCAAGAAAWVMTDAHTTPIPERVAQLAGMWTAAQSSRWSSTPEGQAAGRRVDDVVRADVPAVIDGLTRAIVDLALVHPERYAPLFLHIANVKAADVIWAATKTRLRLGAACAACTRPFEFADKVPAAEVILAAAHPPRFPMLVCGRGHVICAACCGMYAGAGTCPRCHDPMMKPVIPLPVAQYVRSVAEGRFTRPASFLKRLVAGNASEPFVLGGPQRRAAGLVKHRTTPRRGRSRPAGRVHTRGTFDHRRD